MCARPNRACKQIRSRKRPASGRRGGVPWAISIQALSTWSRRGGGAPQRPFRHRLVPRSRNRPLSALSTRTPCALKGLFTGAVSHSSTERPGASLVPLRHIRRIGKADACPWTTPSMQWKCPCKGPVAKAVAERADLSAHRSARPEKCPRQLPSRRPSVTKRPTNCNLFETKKQGARPTRAQPICGFRLRLQTGTSDRGKGAESLLDPGEREALYAMLDKVHQASGDSENA